MKSKLAISILLIGTMFAAFFAEIPAVKADWPLVFEQYGPHVDSLLIKFFPNENMEFQAFGDCGLDLIDWPLTKYWVDQFQNSPEINMMDYGGEIAEDEFDINNNETKPATPYGGPPERNIGHNTAFRHAMAHLVDRAYFITTILQGFGHPEYTKIPSALGEWVNPHVDRHLYDPDGAAGILAKGEDGILGTADDIKDADGDGYYDWPGTVDHIEVDFVYRDDDMILRLMAERFIWVLGTNLPAKLVVVPWPVGHEGDALVKVRKGHTIYLSHRKFKKDPDYLYTYYHSSMYWHPGACPNYNNVNDTELDGYLEGLHYAQNHQQAVINCHAAQECMHREGNTFVIPVCSRTGPKAGKTQWDGFVNEYGFGLNSWWSFLDAHPAGYEFGGVLRYGFKVPEVPSLNPLYGDGYWDWEVMGKVYDTLLRENPYDLSEDLEWVAKRWEVGVWVNPDTGEPATKLTFEIRDDVYWHDGQQLDATDLVFTILELDDLLIANGFPPPWFYSSVKEVNSINVINQFKVEVKMNVMSYFALHWIGELPILPEHVWRLIVTTGDPTGFAPDQNLIGAGPFKVYPHSIDPAANDYYILYQYVKLDAYWEYFNNHPIRVSMATHGSYIDAYLQNYDDTTIWASVGITIDGMPSPGILIANVPAYPTYGNIPGVSIVRFNVTGLPKAVHNVAVTVGYTFGGQAISDTFSRQLLAPSVDGDINGDATVNVLDAIHLSFHFGCDAWVWPEDDLNADNKINVLDAIFLVIHFGQSDP